MNPVQKALWFVESHSREPITLEDIAQASNVSPFHLTRAFAGIMGLSLMRSVRTRRLSEAARQLTNGADKYSPCCSRYWIRITRSVYACVPRIICTDA